MANDMAEERIREAVRERYAGAAKQVLQQKTSSCCGSTGSSCCSSSSSSNYEESIGATNYGSSQLQELPEAAALASLGCGNPTLLAELKEGEVVLDLGSGGGIDVLLSARRVGSTGKAYGLDMTDEMLELARANARVAGATNVEFLKGNIENIPLPDASVDVIISNCVINLSPDKDRVLAEAYRVLKPGGRFAVADIVVQGGHLPDPIRQMMSLWAGCIAGALSDEEYRDKLARAGFAGIDLEVLKVYTLEDVPEEMRLGAPSGLSLPAGTQVVSAFIRATKGAPAGAGKPTRTIAITGKPASFQASPVPTSCCGSSSATASTGAKTASSCCGDTVKSYFKEVAPQWDDMRAGYFTEEVREAAVARADLSPESVVADVGTGTGFMLAGIAPLVKKAYGFDNSPEMLEVARRNLAGTENIELRTAEGSVLPLPDGTLDAVFANMYLHHTPDPASAIAELARVLKPGGRLVITDMDKHDHEWMAREMADVHLGFERDQVEGWFAQAGLGGTRVEGTGTSCCGTSCCQDKADIGVFVASGTRPQVRDEER